MDRQNFDIPSFHHNRIKIFYKKLNGGTVPGCRIRFRSDLDSNGMQSPEAAFIVYQIDAGFK